MNLRTGNWLIMVLLVQFVLMLDPAFSQTSCEIESKRAIAAAGSIGGEQNSHFFMHVSSSFLVKEKTHYRYCYGLRNKHEENLLEAVWEDTDGDPLIRCKDLFPGICQLTSFSVGLEPEAKPQKTALTYGPRGKERTKAFAYFPDTEKPIKPPERKRLGATLKLEDKDRVYVDAEFESILDQEKRELRYVMVNHSKYPFAFQVLVHTEKLTYGRIETSFVKRGLKPVSQWASAQKTIGIDSGQWYYMAPASSEGCGEASNSVASALAYDVKDSKGLGKAVKARIVVRSSGGSERFDRKLWDTKLPTLESRIYIYLPYREE